MVALEETVIKLAGEVRQLLERTGEQLVCAESCTAGLVAATLAKWPGISKWLCGSFVVYQTEIKHQWLGIPSELLHDPIDGPSVGPSVGPSGGPVSQRVTALLALEALEKTPQATLSVAVTGHLGPGAPELLDGFVFIALAKRRKEASGLVNDTNLVMNERLVRLKDLEMVAEPALKRYSGQELRERRMLRAVSNVLEMLREFLAEPPK